MNFVSYAIPFFILAMGVEFLYGWQKKRNPYHLADIINSLQLGTIKDEDPNQPCVYGTTVPLASWNPCGRMYTSGTKG